MDDRCPESSLTAIELIPARGVSKERLAAAAQMLSLGAGTPEWRSLASLARRKYRTPEPDINGMNFENIAFSPLTGVSGIDIDGKSFRKGPCGAVRGYVEKQGGQLSEAVKLICALVRMYGGTPLVIAEGAEVLGVIHFCGAASCGHPDEKTRE